MAHVVLVILYLMQSPDLPVTKLPVASISGNDRPLVTHRELEDEDNIYKIDVGARQNLRHFGTVPPGH